MTTRHAPEDAPVLGFLVNPIAGMGGPVALKGTDDAVGEARDRGATPVSPLRARRFLDALSMEVRVLTCASPMGADVCQSVGVDHEVLVEVEEPTSAEDTQQAARAFQEAGVGLIVFVGGDGTALDVASTVGEGVVCLGVPGGVKMNSAAFGETPEHAARVADAFLGGLVDDHRVEVVEVDEGGLREGVVRRERLGCLRVPMHPGVQGGKAAVGGTLEGVVEAGLELAKPGRVLVLGPGSTVHAIKEALLGREASLLGVDVVRVDEAGEGVCLIEDATAGELEEVGEDALIVVSPIGGQGFVLGRGNQQLVPGLLDRLGWDRLRVVATREKLVGLDALRVDTGDPSLDALAPERVDVLTGPGFRSRLPLRSGPGGVGE